MGKRFSKPIRDQDGFTLPEMLVTIVIMIVVLFALYSIFDAGIRIFSLGNDEVEATENARLGLEKMEREIRAAYPYNLNATPPDKDLFYPANNLGAGAMPSASQITFGNDLNGDLMVTCGAGSACEVITYSLSGDQLMRAEGTGAAQPVVAPVAANGLTFRYYAGTTCNGTVTFGAEIDPASPGSCTQADIAKMGITLRIDQDGRIRELTTDVDMRNRGG